MNKRIYSMTFMIALLSIPITSFAHHAEFMSGSPFLQGLSMPIHGLDHLLFTLAVGLIAAQIGGRALWGVPLVFSIAILLGGILNLSGISIPLMEYGIIASIVLAGAILAWGPSVSLIAVVCGIALLTLFHGNELIVRSDIVKNLPLFTAGCLISALFVLGVGEGIGLLITRLQISAFRYAGLVMVAAAAALMIFPNLNGSIIHILEA